MNDSNNHLSLRKVINTDEDLLLIWANDPEVRKGSFKNHTITKDEHRIWFDKKHRDPNVLMWVFEVNNSPAGLVRLEKDNNEVVLSYQIASQYRGKGLGTKMLKMAMNEVENHWRNIKVMAYTVPGNIASVKSMEKAGFCLESSSDEKIVMFFIKPKNNWLN